MKAAMLLALQLKLPLLLVTPQVTPDAEGFRVTPASGLRMPLA